MIKTLKTGNLKTCPQLTHPGYPGRFLSILRVTVSDTSMS